MGWASDALWRDLGRVGIYPNVQFSSVQHTTVYDAKNTKEETIMDDTITSLVKVCDSRHIIGETNKAIRVRIGQTLYGEPITTFLPKSICQVIYRDNGSFDVYVPLWATRNRTCFIGEFKTEIQPGFSPLI